MAFWVFLLLMACLLPATMLGFGLRFYKRPPQKIQSLFGYRTVRSMKNHDTWTFAHRHIGRTWMICGGVLLPISTTFMLLTLGRTEQTIGTASIALTLCQIVVLMGSILPTEAALKRTFDRNGVRK